MTDVASPAAAIAERVAEWALEIRDDDVPADVVDASRFRLLDVVGLSLAGADTPFGRATRRATVALSGSGPSRILGTGDRVGVTAAAFANAAFAQALEFD